MKLNIAITISILLLSTVLYSQIETNRNVLFHKIILNNNTVYSASNYLDGTCYMSIIHSTMPFNSFHKKTLKNTLVDECYFYNPFSWNISTDNMLYSIASKGKFASFGITNNHLDSILLAKKKVDTEIWRSKQIVTHCYPLINQFEFSPYLKPRNIIYFDFKITLLDTVADGHLIQYKVKLYTLKKQKNKKYKLNIFTLARPHRLINQNVFFTAHCSEDTMWKQINTYNLDFFSPFYVISYNLDTYLLTDTVIYKIKADTILRTGKIIKKRRQKETIVSKFFIDDKDNQEIILFPPYYFVRENEDAPKIRTLSKKDETYKLTMKMAKKYFKKKED